MKQQLKTNLAIEFLGIENWDDIATIEFAFAQFKNGAILKTATYPTNVAREGNVLFIPWTREDTAKSAMDFYRQTTALKKDIFRKTSTVGLA